MKTQVRFFVAVLLAAVSVGSFSVAVGQQPSGQTPADDVVRVNAELAAHRFSRADHLGYLVFIYNAKRDAKGTTNLTVETQVLLDGKVISAAQQKVSDNPADPQRIPYGADITLKSLAPGSYDLRVKITDAVAGTSATQSTEFFVQ